MTFRRTLLLTLAISCFIALVPDHAAAQVRVTVEADEPICEEEPTSVNVEVRCPGDPAPLQLTQGSAPSRLTLRPVNLRRPALLVALGFGMSGLFSYMTVLNGRLCGDCRAMRWSGLLAASAWSVGITGLVKLVYRIHKRTRIRQGLASRPLNTSSQARRFNGTRITW